MAVIEEPLRDGLHLGAAADGDDARRRVADRLVHHAGLRRPANRLSLFGRLMGLHEAAPLSQLRNLGMPRHVWVSRQSMAEHCTHVGRHTDANVAAPSGRDRSTADRRLRKSSWLGGGTMSITAQGRHFRQVTVRSADRDARSWTGLPSVDAADLLRVSHSSDTNRLLSPPGRRTTTPAHPSG